MKNCNYRTFACGFFIISGLATSGCDRGFPDRFSDWISKFPNPFQAYQDPVLAKSGEIEIRVSEYRPYLTAKNPKKLKIVGNSGNGIVQQIMRRKILDKLAENAGVRPDPILGGRVDGIENTVSYRNLLVAMPVSDDEISSFYNLHKNEFVGRTIKFSHIVVSSRERAQETRANLKKGQHIAGMRLYNGTLDQLAQMDPIIADHVSSASPGQILDPIPTLEGFEVIRREKVDSKPLPLAEVRSQVRYRIAAEKLSENVAQQMKNLVINQDLLNALK